MRRPSWLIDTLARRLALTGIATVVVTLGLVFLFNEIGGTLFQEPLERSGLLDEAVGMVEAIEAAPPEIRSSIAASISKPEKQVYWFAAQSRGARLWDASRGHEGTVRQTVAHSTRRTVVALKPAHDPVPQGLVPDSGGTPRYLLGVRLLDHSWVVFGAPRRIWGMPEYARWVIRLLFLTVSITVFTAISARRLAAPIKRLAAAVREFGVNPRAPPIPESGPLEVRQVVKTFNEMQAQIQKFVAYRTMMLAAISHDLRTPLTRMRLRGEFIEDPEQQARLFRDVDDMQAMVDGALAFFRDDAVDEPSTTFDLPQVLLTIVNDYADHKMEIRYLGPAHTVYQGRPFALQRAFTNLIENAIKYATPPELELLCEPQAVVVVVRDRGPGIPDALLQEVFLPYYRVEKSRNRNTGGVGLGLTVALAIIHGHGGEIVLSNLPGGGLEARVVLPRS
jgi:signal transduction histidine kinase